jgi:exopolyphosphatase/guanosine-5'-triphosphate,3'-diphosphate pyrophosphatase
MNRHETESPVAVLDIGTNSMKLLVATGDGPHVYARHFARVTTRLGTGLHKNGRISPAATARAVDAARKLVAEARRNGATHVVAVGTYAFRAAENGARVAAAIGRAAGIEMRILSGREEARMAFLSARSRLNRAPAAALLVDVGGGSAQWVAARGTTIVGTTSLPLGALQLTERYLHADPIEPAEYLRMKERIDRAVAPVAAKYASIAPRATLIAVGGSATTALAMARRDAGGQSWNGTVSLAELRRLEKACLEKTIAARKRMPGLPPDRAEIIPAGIAVVIAIMTAARKRVVHISGGGVREGVVLAMTRER